MITAELQAATMSSPAASPAGPPANLNSSHTLDLPPGVIENVVCILDDAIDQLAILGDIGNRDPHDRRPGGDSVVGPVARGPMTKGAQAARHQQSAPGRSSTNKAVSGTGAASAGAAGHSHGHAPTADPATISRERAALQQLLARAAGELRQRPKPFVGSLARAVDEERTRRNQLPDAQARERAAAAALRDAQRALGEEQKIRERERRERERVIQQLREAIQEIMALTASEQKYLKKETRAHEAQAKAMYAHAEKRLLAEKTALSRRLEMESKCHAAVVDYLNRQRATLERQIQEWMGRHEEDTDKKTAEIESLKSSRSSDVDRFEELVAKYEELERLVDEDKARRAQELEERRLARIEMVRGRAAKKIQVWWRTKRGKRGESAGDKKGGSAGKKGSAKGKRSASASNKKGKK